MTDEERLITKLRKVLALTTSPVEGEAMAAAEMLQRLLTAHNLEIADLEVRGGKVQSVGEGGHDLGKSPWKWKLRLADIVADHYFCLSLTDHDTKTVRFVGRHDNVESLKLLYSWLIEQIRVIARSERHLHWVRTNEHIDPLRWQLGFGMGVVQRLEQRLADIKQRQNDQSTTALVLHHQSEISDWLEEKFGFRRDGRQTKRDIEWRAKYDEDCRKREELKQSDPEEYYRQRPWERPDAIAKRDAEAAKRNAKVDAAWDRKYERERARKNKPESEAARVRRVQSAASRDAGAAAADKVNLQPFLNGDDPARRKVGE